MSFDDLDLEFEDEEEEATKKKVNEAVHVDVDIQFQSPPPEKDRIRSQPVATTASFPRPLSVEATPKTTSRPEAVVRKIEDARGATSEIKRTSPHASSPRIQGATALKQAPAQDFEGEEVIRLREQLRQVEFQADVRVQVAEFKTEFLTDIMSDMKLMELQIGQLLARINAKHPDLKNEALMIKKILADFNGKKRK